MMQRLTYFVLLNAATVVSENSMRFKRLRKYLMSVNDIGSFKSERQYADECAHRPTLTDDEFLAAYYPSTDMGRTIPLHVRRVLEEQLGFNKIVPSDCPCDILHNIDLQVVLDEIGDEFGTSLAVDELPDQSGSFDSIVRLVDSKLSKQ